MYNPQSGTYIYTNYIYSEYMISLCLNEHIFFFILLNDNDNDLFKVSIFLLLALGNSHADTLLVANKKHVFIERVLGLKYVQK